MDTGYFEECLFLELKRPQNQVYKDIRDVEASDFAGFDGTPRGPVVRVLDVCQAFAAALIAPRGLVKGRGFNVGIPNGNSSVADLAEAVWDLDRRMVEALASHGVEVLKSYYNFHHWDEACGCRKQKPGMLIQPSRE
jgi:nucleoside-diphosphate-sugar epimerase